MKRKLSSLLLTLTLALTPSPVAAAPLGDLLLRGFQVLQLNNISQRDEIALGQQMHRQLLSQEFQVSRDRQSRNKVNQIGQRLARVSPRPDLPFTFTVVQDREVNAFATLGGYVYVTTGLLQVANTQDQLAGVLSHEITHITDRHLLDQMQQRAIAQGLASAVGLNENTLVGLGTNLALNLPQSREDEFEADTGGINLMRRAGYNPQGMVTFLTKLLRSSSSPSFLSTHPATQERIQALNRQLGSERYQ
ncbi:M48 family metallopeptidase [Candidatus Cyanaurora vandensis]|uniref:M48 family metallopeptidase n=1 Tax=Candidatus Cyanaurora vandensis TaxID=2714958 RepID=UPI0025797992|nr:M48 family metallopeptidase [Candidatus Cyanaurora vandensis]